MDFLDFRDMLRPASGFQSWQFKQLEAKLGLKFEHRHGKEYYTSQLRKEHVDVIKSAEGNNRYLSLLIPGLKECHYLHHYQLIQIPSGRSIEKAMKEVLLTQRKET